MYTKSTSFLRNSTYLLLYEIINRSEKSYVINKSKLEVLELLGHQIEASNQVQEGISFFDGFELLSVKKFYFNLQAISIYRAVLKVKEKGEKVIVESTINTYWYSEFTLFIMTIFSLIFSTLIACHCFVHPLFNVRPSTGSGFWIFGPVWLLSIFLGFKRINSFRVEGQQIIDSLLAPLKD